MEELSAEKLSAKYHEKVRKNQVEPEIQENDEKNHVTSISEDLLRRRVTFSSLQVILLVQYIIFQLKFKYRHKYLSKFRPHMAKKSYQRPIWQFFTLILL